MSYISNEEDEQQSGMNVLAQPNQQQTSPESQNQPQNVSGGESATIGGGQAQQSPQPKSKAPKKAKSGMFTNLRKYMDRNKPGAQKMAGKLQQNISQQNVNIQQAINKQKTDFMSRVNQNRQRLQQAGQFGQQTIQQAQTQEAMPQMQAQEQQLQQRIGNIGQQDLTYAQNFAQAQPQQSFEDYTKRQLGFAGAEQGVTDAQKAYQQAQEVQQSQQQQLAGSLADQQIQSGMERQALLGQMTPTYYSQEQIQQQMQDPSQQFLEQVQMSIGKQLEQIITKAQDNAVGGKIYSPEQQTQIDELQNRMNQLNAYKESVAASQAAQQAQQAAVGKLEGLRSDLDVAQEQQRLYQNKQALEGELAQLQDKMTNAPEAMTEEDIARFNNLRTGVERFDTAILNLSEQQRGVQDLTQQAESLGTLQGRRELMRQEFGRQGGYTSGQAALDNLILTGDRQAMTNLIEGSRAQAQQAKASLDEAYRQGRISQDEMTRGTRQLQEQLNTQVQEAQSALEQGLAQRAETGEGTMLKQLQDKLASGQGFSAEELNILGIDPSNPYATISDEMLRDIKIDPNQFSIQDVATSQDVARAEALARLAGGQPEDYMQSALGLEQDEIARIQERGVMDEEGGFGTTFEELSQADREALSGVRGETAKQQAQVKQLSNKIESHKSAAQRALGERSKEGGGTPHWKYWNHIYHQELERAKNARNAITNMMSEDSMVRSESTTKQQALENYLNKFRK